MNHMFTRKHSFLRRLKPDNIIGTLLGYASCDCGNNFWLNCGNGYMTGKGSGRTTCKDCSKTFVEQIDENNHRIQITPPEYGLVGLGYTVCQKKDCKICGVDVDKYWKDGWYYKEEFLEKYPEWNKVLNP